MYTGVVNPLILMALIVAAPTILIVLTRTKAALVFMALCVGSVLTTFVGDTALDMVQLFTRSYSQTTLAGVKLGLLILPALLTMLFLSRMVAGSKMIMNLLPALLTGIVTLYLVVPVLPDGVSGSIMANSVWTELVQYQSILVGATSLISLGQLWASGASARHGKKGKHK